MKTIAVVNQKGGCGKTTTTALLCKSLVHEGKRVLCIDTDPQGGLSGLFSQGKAKGLFECVSWLGPTVQEATTWPIEGQLGLIKADYRIDAVFAGVDPYCIQNLLSSGKDYDFCIIDTPPTLQGITRATILASDMVLVPCELSDTAYDPTLYTIEKIKGLRKKAKVLFIGYKEPKGNGYRAELLRLYVKAFGACQSLPKTATVPKQARLSTKQSKATLELIYPILLESIGAKNAKGSGKMRNKIIGSQPRATKSIQIAKELEQVQGLMPMDSSDYERLKDDIQKEGVKDPLRGYSKGTQFFILSGFHRLRIAKEIGLELVPTQTL